MSKVFAKTNLKKMAAGFMTSAVLALSTVSTVSAQNFISQGDNPVASATGGQSSLRLLVLQIVNFFLGFLGLIAVVMIIYGGFLYISAAGKEDKVEQGKKIIMYSVIGILIILASFAIVYTILGAGTAGTN